MPEYIDKEKLIRDLIDNRSFYPAIVKSAIENAPTEDVVPRSEVEKLRKENIELNLKNQLLYDEGKSWYDDYHKIKEDLKQEKKYKRASEKLADKYFAELQTTKAELNQAKQEVAREIIDNISRYISLNENISKKCKEENGEQNREYFKGKLSAFLQVQGFIDIEFKR